MIGILYNLNSRTVWAAVAYKALQSERLQAQILL
jgi:hypothetical protein